MVIHHQVLLNNKSRKISILRDLSVSSLLIVAEAGGFEPPERLPVRQFSKLLVSATHPNFQYLCSAYGTRTRVSAVRGPRPRPLDEGAIKKSDRDRIQTCNRLIRSQLLYSVELRGHLKLLLAEAGGFEPPVR